MSTRDQLTEEERSILAFAQADLKKHGMNRALAMVQKTDVKLIDLRTLIGSYQDRWRRQRGQLKVKAPLKMVDTRRPGAIDSAPMQRYKDHPIYTMALPALGKRWRSIGMVFDPEHPAKEIKRLETGQSAYTTSEEAEEHALALCKAWVDGLGAASEKAN
jgi:hypothetical protein